MADMANRFIDQVRTAIADQSPLSIVGGNSKAFLGGARYGDPLNVSDHTGIVSYQPEELVITARAGTSIAEIQQVLQEQGQSLPSEPPHFEERATLGGTLACNLSGPARPWRGSFRDHVLGIRLINGRAEHLRFGGQVMKNVAGYDVARMQAGAMGTYGVITEISLKVLPQLPASVTLTQPVLVSDAVGLMNQWAGKKAPLTGACWIDGQVYLRFSGVQAAIDDVARGWRGEIANNAIWHQLREQQLPFFQAEHSSKHNLWRFSVKSTAPLFLSEALPEKNWLIDWAGSLRWLAGEYSLAELESLAESAGGHVSLYRGRDETMLQSPDVVTRALLIRLKEAFDPHRIFNQGRLYHWM